MNKLRVDRVKFKDLSVSLLERLEVLWQRVWPDKQGRSLDELTEFHWDHLVVADTEESRSGVMHFVEDADVVVAVARTFGRQIVFCDSGEEATVLALASVCVDPDRRGEGLGKLVVEDAFLRLEQEGGVFDFSLFQTPVSGFYVPFGAQVVANEFINSLSEDDPSANPWWDKEIMVCPFNEKWREGRVDLKGSGY